MYYILTMTLKEGKAVPVSLPNHNISRPDLETPGLTQYTIFAKFHNLTVRVVDSNGQLAATFDGVYQCGPLIRSYVYRRETRLNKGTCICPNFLFSNSENDFTKIQITAVGDTSHHKPTAFIQERRKVAIKPLENRVPLYIYDSEDYREMQLPITRPGEANVYATLPKSGETRRLNSYAFQETGAHVYIVDKAVSIFRDIDAHHPYYPALLKNCFSSISASSYKAIAGRYEGAEHEFGVDHADNVTKESGVYEQKMYQGTEIINMNDEEFERLLTRITEYPEDKVKKNLSRIEINRIILRGADLDEKTRRLGGRGSLGPTFLERFTAIPVLEKYARRALSIKETNSGGLKFFLTDPFTFTNAWENSSEKITSRSKATLAKAPPPPVLPAPPSPPAPPVLHDTKEDASQQLTAALSKLPNVSYGLLPDAQQSYLEDLEFLEGIEPIEPPEKRPRLQPESDNTEYYSQAELATLDGALNSFLYPNDLTPEEL